MPRQRKFYTKNKTTSLEQLPREVREVFICVSNSLNCDISQILGNSRDRQLVDARHIAIVLIWEYYGSNGTSKGYTLKMLGTFFNRHHSSIIHAIDKAKNLRLVDDTFCSNYQKVHRNLKTLQKRPDISKLIEMIELLNKTNAVKVEEYISDVLNLQTKTPNVELSTFLGNQVHEAVIL